MSGGGNPRPGSWRRTRYRALLHPAFEYQRRRADLEGGPYEISASTAQPGGVGIVAEGPYTLENGFWAAVLAILASEAPGINYDIAPETLDGFIDARDLLGWYERIVDEIEEANLLFDFSRFWQGPFPPTQK